MEMQIICLEQKCFYELLDRVIRHIREKHNVTQDRWVTPQEAQRLLNVGKTCLQTLRNEGKLAYSHPMRKVILYDRLSIESYLKNHIKRTF
jgi:hypothetical protein